MTQTLNDNDLRYWIAINGASCAMTSCPLQHPLVTPTPEQLVGFPTWEEAREAQRVCLHEPIATVRQFFDSRAPRVRSGEILVIVPAHPQPPTRGSTAWAEDADVHAVLQQVAAPDDVN